MDISQLSDEKFAALFSQMISKIQQDPIKYFVRAKGFLDVDPTPAQEVVLKIVFGILLDPITKKEVRFETRNANGEFALKIVEMSEYEIYRYLTETDYDSENVQLIKINKIDLILGRRSGKTMVAAIIAIYCAISNNWKSFLKKTPFATVLILSHSREFSDEVLELIRTLIEASDVLSRLVYKDKKNTASTMNLVTPWIVGEKIISSRVQIKVAAASSKTTRGIAACAVLCDEIAFWQSDENLKETDEKIIKAVRPALKQFGELAILIKLSSPGIKRGVLYDEYEKHRAGDLPDSYAVFKAPSWVMSPADILSERDLREEWILDPDSFGVEYGGNFSDSFSNFITPELIDMATLKGITFQPPDSSVHYRAAIDSAYVGDTFTFSVVGYANGRCVQHISKGWKGSKLKPVDIFEVAEYIRVVCKEFGIPEVGADQYSFQPLRQIFERFNIVLTEYVFNQEFKKKIYSNLKNLFTNRQIDILDNELQAREIKELIVDQSPNGSVRISHPAGGHDDYADSLAIAAFLATQSLGSADFNFHSSITVNTYGVKTDINGVAFGAPSPELLSNSGHLPENLMDNAAEFAKHPKTGQLVRLIDLEDDEESEDSEKFDFSF